MGTEAEQEPAEMASVVAGWWGECSCTHVGPGQHTPWSLLPESITGLKVRFSAGKTGDSRTTGQ